MSEDLHHQLCKVQMDVAVLDERGKATAMALVLAEKLAAADKKLIISFLIGGIGWAILIASMFLNHK